MEKNKDLLLKVANDIEQNPGDYRGDNWWSPNKTKETAGWAMVRILLEVGEVIAEEGEAVVIRMPNGDIVFPTGSDYTYRAGLEKLTGILQREWNIFTTRSPQWTPGKTVQALRCLYENNSLDNFDLSSDATSTTYATQSGEEDTNGE